FWAATDRGPERMVFPNEHAVCFVQRTADAEGHVRRQSVDLRALDNAPVDALYFNSTRALAQTRERLRDRNIPVMESDIKPADRFLMERFITGGLRIEGHAANPNGYLEFTSPALQSASVHPSFRIVSLDIETEGFTGALYS